MSDSGAVVLFDGLCNLCARTVQFIIAHDPSGRFRFAPLQSDIGADLMRRCGLDHAAADTVVLIEGTRCHQRSDAALRIARRLCGPWRHLYWCRFVPRWLRDRIYDFMARRRYGWFGKREACLTPQAGMRDRFLNWQAASSNRLAVRKGAATVSPCSGDRTPTSDLRESPRSPPASSPTDRCG